MSEFLTGRIVRSLSGFYEVETEDGFVECKARGHFRKERISPLVGDWVEISRTGAKGMVERITPRRNQFVRPAVSNMDLLVLLAANVNPVTEPFLIDRVAAIAGNQNVPVAICVNKCDLDPGDKLVQTYEKAGFPTFRISAATGEGIDALRQQISGKTVVFTGNSGVGKSSVLNRLAPELGLAVGEVSQKLGRGRHTTRHVELYKLADGTYVADTPGFASFDTDQMEIILKENLQYAFTDFAPYLGQCQFHDCAHVAEPGCAVREAVESGAISRSRYDSYCKLYEKAKEIKLWEQKQR